MLKRILISILSVLIILIMITGVFHYFVKVCDEYLLPKNGAVDYDAVDDAENRTVEYVFSFDAPTGEFSSKGTTSSVCSKLVVVIGRINTERRYYYNIFNSEEKIVAKGKFGEDTKTCIIRDIRVSSNGINILCENEDRITVYNISSFDNSSGDGMKSKEVVSVYPEIKEDTILDLIFPDNKGEYFIVACSKTAYVYNMKGEITKTYEYSPKSIITSAVYSDGVLVLCGADTDSEDGIGFSFGFAEAFDDEGKLLWSERVFNKADCVSAVTECQINNNGNIVLYGRYYDYSESDVVLTSLDNSRFEEFERYGHGNDYYVYTGKESGKDGEVTQTSAFFAEMDSSGNEIEMTVYSALNDRRVPSISQEMSLNKLNADGNISLTLAQAASLNDNSYFLTIDGEMVEIPRNVHVVFVKNTDGAVFAYISESSMNVYKMKYFSSVKAFADGMRELDRALKVSEILDYVPVVLPWMLISVLFIILLIAKHKWRVVDGE